jgi:hypothetical protein
MESLPVLFCITNRTGMQDEMRSFCKSDDKCLRYQLLASLDYEDTQLLLGQCILAATYMNRSALAHNV